jgi:hypothetical protein
MEPTAALEVELRAPDGELLAGARVDVWPNACWLIGACGIFLDDRTWSAVTDERGLARIENIPAGEHNFGVAHDAYELSLDPPGEPTAQRHRRGTFEPGQTQRVELKLERRGG